MGREPRQHRLRHQPRHRHLPGGAQDQQGLNAGEQAALERGGEGRLAIERTKDNAKPSRLPLLLWVVFGGAGLVFVFVRYGRR